MLQRRSSDGNEQVGIVGKTLGTEFPCQLGISVESGPRVLNHTPVMVMWQQGDTLRLYSTVLLVLGLYHEAACSTDNQQQSRYLSISTCNQSYTSPAFSPQYGRQSRMGVYHWACRPGFDSDVSRSFKSDVGVSVHIYTASINAYH